MLTATLPNADFSYSRPYVEYLTKRIATCSDWTCLLETHLQVPIQVVALSLFDSLAHIGLAGATLSGVVIKQLSLGRLVGLDDRFTLRSVSLHVYHAVGYFLIAVVGLPLGLVQPHAVIWLHEAAGLHPLHEVSTHPLTLSARIQKVLSKPHVWVGLALVGIAVALAVAYASEPDPKTPPIDPPPIPDPLPIDPPRTWSSFFFWWLVVPSAAFWGIQFTAVWTFLAYKYWQCPELTFKERAILCANEFARLVTHNMELQQRRGSTIVPLPEGMTEGDKLREHVKAYKADLASQQKYDQETLFLIARVRGACKAHHAAHQQEHKTAERFAFCEVAFGSLPQNVKAYTKTLFWEKMLTALQQQNAALRARNEKDPEKVAVGKTISVAILSRGEATKAWRGSEGLTDEHKRLIEEVMNA